MRFKLTSFAYHWLVLWLTTIFRFEIHLWIPFIQLRNTAPSIYSLSYLKLLGYFICLIIHSAGSFVATKWIIWTSFWVFTILRPPTAVYCSSWRAVLSQNQLRSHFGTHNAFWVIDCLSCSFWWKILATCLAHPGRWQEGTPELCRRGYHTRIFLLLHFVWWLYLKASWHLANSGKRFNGNFWLNYEGFWYSWYCIVKRNSRSGWSLRTELFRNLRKIFA